MLYTKRSKYKGGSGKPLSRKKKALQKHIIESTNLPDVNKLPQAFVSTFNSADRTKNTPSIQRHVRSRSRSSSPETSKHHSPHTPPRNTRKHGRPIRPSERKLYEILNAERDRLNAEYVKQLNKTKKLRDKIRAIHIITESDEETPPKRVTLNPIKVKQESKYLLPDRQNVSAMAIMEKHLNDSSNSSSSSNKIYNDYDMYDVFDV